MATWFNKYDSIKNIVIEEGVTSIGNWAFSDCTSLTNVTIPNSITYIGRSAFSDCYSLTNIKIPSNVTKVGNGAFGGCKSLKKIYYKRGTKIDLEALTLGNKAELIPYDEFPPVEENIAVYSNTKYERAENPLPIDKKLWSNVDDKTAAIRKAAELAAMNIVMNIERNLGFVPVDVSSQNLGYDIKSTSPDGKISRLIEVKGRYIDAESVTVSRNEIIAALNNPDNFILAIVKLDADKNETIYLKRPFEQPPDKAALSINLSIQKLVEAAQIIPS